ncbi:hypothetical protein TPY_1986 [Sulfobacillus acidophilus TPY]|uniref:DUF2250 domain-containing protein n=1 Tax=Sulfobacillus acidophilus (strain ATCC 700253 / DSM 10332 / NAL) TaxID=679936 RepID=G8TTJ2_SULAD|nr:hypothetical protein TPY_1986 [Sulfobacillus acidophilus TPY]AEW05658.1 hypothetical protein Sulac_2179 [Sulfobacillus acidophilus DSM 10332]
MQGGSSEGDDRISPVGPIVEGTDALDRAILAYLKALGPDYAKLLSIRLARHYHRRLKAVKHRNHTYYQLTRDGEHFLRRHPTHPPPIERPRR